MYREENKGDMALANKKIRKSYGARHKLNCGLCGFGNCGQFAIIVNCKIPYNSPSPGGRGIHPYLNPLPSRERNFIRDYTVNYNLVMDRKAFMLD